MFRNTSTGSLMDNAIVRYAGLAGYHQGSPIYVGAIEIRDASPTISDCRITTNALHGIHILGSSLPTILGCNEISNNAQYGIINEGSNTISAANNWWGSVTGPKHATLNPTGTGNKVSDRVTFSPWRTNECRSETPDMTIRLFLPVAKR